MATSVYFAAISKRYGGTTALCDVNLRVAAGEIVAVLGPSGSGKTTLLNVCVGAVRPTSGRVFLDAEDVTDWPIEQRDIGVVFQSYALFPHMSVLENVEFSLRTRRHRIPRADAMRLAAAMLDLVGLHGYEQRKPHQLSGGQQQRVALARALVFRPRLLLLDEPLAALEPTRREQLQRDLRQVRDELGVTIVLVTHDQREAMSIADQLVILYEGQLVQSGSPREVYERPASSLAAVLVGEANFLAGIVREREQGIVTVETETCDIRASAPIDFPLGAQVTTIVRPHTLRLSEAKDAGEMPNNFLIGRITEKTFLGSSACVTVKVADKNDWRVYLPPAHLATLVLDQEVTLVWSANDTTLIDQGRKDVDVRGQEYRAPHFVAATT